MQSEWAETSRHGSSAAAENFTFFDYVSQIFDGLVHPLKLVQIKNPFGILQTNPQIPREWVGNFDFQKNMFGWDTLVIPNCFLTCVILMYNIYLWLPQGNSSPKWTLPQISAPLNEQEDEAPSLYHWLP